MDLVVQVLPFVDLTGCEDGCRFADGLTEELISSLSKVGGLRVVCRSWAFQLTAKAGEGGKAAGDLNAVAIVEGAVRRSGRRLRVTARLIDAIRGCSVWSGSHDRKMRDTLATQAQIARIIVNAMRGYLASIRPGATRRSRHIMLN